MENKKWNDGLDQGQPCKHKYFKLKNMREGGVFVRGKKQPFLMHHKFCIVDDSLLINGSFNWTGTAVMGNNENVVITSNTKVVSSFVKEFDKLWSKHAPGS